MPKLQSFRGDLAALGYKINGADQVVDKKTGERFKFFISDNDEVNLKHKEAIHQAVRKEVLDKLAEYDVKEVFLANPEYREIYADRPGSHIPYVTILATDLETLKQKTDVVVVIPDHNLDLGISSYRELMGSGGVERGSILGLVKQLSGLKLRAVDKVSVRNMPAMMPARSDFKSVMSAIKDSGAKDGPGIVVLNTAELHYSHQEHKGYSIQGWLARDRNDALEWPHEIEYQYNRVPGHKTAQKHVNTVLGSVLPKLTSSEARLYLITVNDASEYLVTYMNGRLQDPYRKMMVPGRRTKALAFIEPTHNPNDISIELAKLKISEMGKSWVLSGHPLGTKLTVPERSDPLARIFEDMIYSDPVAIPRAVGEMVRARKKMRERYGHSKNDRSQRRRAFTVGCSPFVSEVLTAHPPFDAIPWPEWLLEKPSPPSSTDPSPTDDMLFANKEKLFSKGLTKPISCVFPMDDVTTLKSVDFAKRTPQAPGGSSNVKAGISGMRNSNRDSIVRDFAYSSTPAAPPPSSKANSGVSGLQTPNRDVLTPDFAHRVSLTPNPLEPRPNETAGSRQKDKGSRMIITDRNNPFATPDPKCNDPSPVDPNEEAVFSGSESEGVPEGSKLIGGDFDDGGDGEGLWMKRYQKTSTTTKPVKLGNISADATEDPGEEDKEFVDVDNDSMSDDEGVSVSSVPGLSPDVRSAGGSEDSKFLSSERESEGATSESDEGSASGDVGAKKGITDISDHDSVYEKVEDLGWLDEEGALVREDSVTLVGSLGSDEGDAAPVPEIGDMLRVSSGEEREVELIWGKVVGEVVEFFVEMGRKDTR